MIGREIWYFDQNRRVYPTDENGRYIPGQSVIWREHWDKRFVVGETRVSWIVGMAVDWGADHRACVKVPKKGPLPSGWSWSQVEIDELAWVEKHRYKIIRCLERCREPKVLREIAKLIGYKDDAA